MYIRFCLHWRQLQYIHSLLTGETTRVLCTCTSALFVVCRAFPMTHFSAPCDGCTAVHAICLRYFSLLSATCSYVSVTVRKESVGILHTINFPTGKFINCYLLAVGQSSFWGGGYIKHVAVGVLWTSCCGKCSSLSILSVCMFTYKVFLV